MAFELEFNIDDVLAESERTGVLTSEQVAKIKNKRKSINNSGTKQMTTGDKAAGVAGLVGDQITNADTTGTNTTSQTAGGALSGAATGFAVGGPWGAAVGGVLGGVTGALQAGKNREAANNAAESKRVASVANIENRATQDRNNQVNAIINNLSQALLR